MAAFIIWFHPGVKEIPHFCENIFTKYRKLSAVFETIG